MEWLPKVLQPTPDPFYEAEVQKIDKDLRIVWGMERYALKRWVVERHIPPERYQLMYHSLIESGEDRFVEQPVFDTNQPLFDDEGQETGGFVQIGTRKFDLAPEWECVLIVEDENHEFCPFDMRAMTQLKRAYAWDRFHSLSRLKAEKDAEREAKESAAKEKRVDAAFQEFKDHRREIFKLPFMGQPSKVMEGTNLKKELQNKTI